MIGWWLVIQGCAQAPWPLEGSPVDCDALAVRIDGASTFYGSNPVYSDPADRLGPYEVVAPSDVGLDEKRLEAATAELRSRPFVNSLLVFRQGRLAWERYLHGAEPGDSHNVHSASKSLLAVATGVAVERGWISVDDPVADFLPEVRAQDPDGRKRSITVEHLLTMTSGLEWVEDRTEYEVQETRDWVATIAGQPLVADPGTRFLYSTGDTHLLSAALQAASGVSTCELVHRLVLQPLDVDAEHWGRDPQGVSSGGFDVHLTPRELARFGLLVAGRGQWGDIRVVEAAWVERMLDPSQRDGDYGYGYLWWTRQLAGHDVAIAWGYGGQLIYLVDDLDLVVVVTTDTGRYDPASFEAEAILELLLPTP